MIKEISEQPRVINNLVNTLEEQVKKLSGGKTREKARRHCEDTPWHPHRFNTDLSEDFIEVVADMMEKDPKQRIHSAEEVVARLEPWSAEADSLMPKTMSKSPWTLPPPPSPAGSADELEDTDAGSGALDASDYPSQGSASQGSQGTDSVASAADETRPNHGSRRSDAPPIPQPDQPEPFPAWFESLPFPPWVILLALVVPVSMFIGAVLTLALVVWIW